MALRKNLDFLDLSHKLVTITIDNNVYVLEEVVSVDVVTNQSNTLSVVAGSNKGTVSTSFAPVDITVVFRDVNTTEAIKEMNKAKNKQRRISFLVAPKEDSESDCLGGIGFEQGVISELSSPVNYTEGEGFRNITLVMQVTESFFIAKDTQGNDL